MPRPLATVFLATLMLLGLGGCVAYPVDGYYAEPAPVYTPPPTIYFGGTFGPSYRPHYGHRHWGGGGWGHRDWR